MLKTINLLLIILILIFSYTIFKYYTSNKNLKLINFKRKNINQIIDEKTLNLPILKNNTNDVIEFNNSLSNKTDKYKSRSFWDLLKTTK